MKFKEEEIFADFCLEKNPENSLMVEAGMGSDFDMDVLGESDMDVLGLQRRLGILVAYIGHKF
jgi:hypothetical protein